MSRTPVPSTLRRRFWLEGVLGLTTAVLALTTAVRPDWIELVVGAEPDAGDGSAERWMVLALAAVTVAMLAASRLEWRRATRLRAALD